MAKDFFKENNIPFTDYNVGTDIAKRSEMLEKSGQMGVPVIVVDNKDVIVGFDQPKLKELLGVLWNTNIKTIIYFALYEIDKTYHTIF